MESLSSALARRLSELRKAEGMSETALAEKIGTSRSTVRRLLKNEASMDVDMLDMLAHYLKTDILTLVELAVQDAPVRPARIETIRETAVRALRHGLGKKNEQEG